MEKNVCKISRRLQWKIGRRMYMRARGELTETHPAISGEAYVQRSVLTGATDVDRLVVLDVGANKGQWSSEFLRSLPHERRNNRKFELHAFEPAPESRRNYLEDPIIREHSSLLELHALALSNKQGKTSFFITEASAGTNSLFHDSKSPISATSIEVSTDTADAFCGERNIRNVHLLKIDTEGNDAYVLQGASNLLSSEALSVVQFEYNHRWINSRAYLKDIFQLIADTPYVLAKVRRNFLERYDTWDQELERFFEANYVLIHPRAFSWFRVVAAELTEDNVYL